MPSPNQTEPQSLYTNEIIGRNIRRWREHRDMKAEDLGKAVGLDKSVISQLENGKKEFTLSLLNGIAQELKLTLPQLLHTDPQTIVTLTQNTNSNGINYGTQHNSIVDKEILSDLRAQLRIKDEQLNAKDRQIEFLQQSFAAR